jgi:hypothetical protein
MRYRPATRATSLVLLVFGVAVFVIVSFFRERHDVTVLQVFLAIVVLMLTSGTIQVFGIAHRLVPGGIERRSPFRQRVLVRWADVSAIEWVPRTRWYELASRRGERLRVAQQLTNVEAFARAALEGIPAEVIDARPGLRAQLDETARGISPPIDHDREEWRGG